MGEIITKYFITKYFLLEQLQIMLLLISTHVCYQHIQKQVICTLISVHANLQNICVALQFCIFVYVLDFMIFFLVATHVFCIMKQFSSFSFCMHFIPFPCFTEVSRSSNVTLNRSKRKNLFLILDIQCVITIYMICKPLCVLFIKMKKSLMVLVD